MIHNLDNTNSISITKLIILLKNILFEMYKHAKYMEKKKIMPFEKLNIEPAPPMELYWDLVLV